MADTQNTVNVTLQGRDELSPALQRSTIPLQLLEDLLRNLGTRLDAAGLSQRELAKVLGEGERAMQQFGVRTTEAGQIVDRFGGQLGGRSITAMRELNTELAAGRERLQQLQTWGINASQSVSGFSTAMGAATGVLAAFGVSLSLRTLVDFGTSVIQTGAKLEQLRASLTAVTGGIEQGQRAYRDITEIANTYGFSVENLTNLYKNLAAATRGTAIEGEQTRRIFEAVTLAARTLGASNQQVEGAFRALEQMVSKGTVSMEELRRQLGNALPGAFEIAARAMGVSTAALEEMVRNGEVQAIPFLVRLGEQLRREFGGAAVEASKTATTAFAQLENEWMALKDRIARSGPLRFVTQIVRSAAAFVGQGQREEEALDRDIQGRVGNGLEGATPAQRDAFRRLQQELQSLQGPPLATPGGLIPRRSREDIEREQEALLTEIRAQRSLQQVERQRAQEDEEAIAAQVTKRVELQVQNKKLQETLDALTAAEDKLNKSSQLAPQAFGSATGTIDQRIEFFNRQQKLLQKAVEDLTEQAVTRQRSALGAVPAEIEAAIKEAVSRLAQADEQLEKAEQARRDKAKAERQADAAARKQQRDEERAAARAEREVQQDTATLEGFRRQLTLNKEARVELTAAEIAARNPHNEVIQALANEVIALASAREGYKEEVAALQESFVALKQRADAQRAAEDAQAKYNEKLRETLQIIQAPINERLSARLRTQAPGNFTTPDQETLLAQIDQAERARDQAREVERIFRDMGRNIDRTFESLWQDIFSGGIKSAKGFGLSVAQSLQRIFAQLASGMLSMLLSQVTGAKFSEGGAGGALAGVLIKLAGSLFSGAAGGAVSGAAGSGYDYSGGFSGGADIGAFQHGGVVRGPRFAFIEPGMHEAIVPLKGGAIPVRMQGAPRSQAQEQPIIIQLHQDFSNTVDPRALRMTDKEIIGVVVKDLTNDGITRRVILQQRS